METWIIGLVVLAVPAATVATVVALRRKRRMPPSPRDQQVPGAAPPEPLSEPAVPAFAPGTERAFAASCHRFTGLYEALHRVVVQTPDVDDTRWVLGEWETRLAYSDTRDLQQTWRDLVQQTTGMEDLNDGDSTSDENIPRLGQLWLQLVQHWGMTRDERERFHFDEPERDRYRISGSPRPGDLVDVRRACWTFEGEVIERGIAETTMVRSE